MGSGGYSQYYWPKVSDCSISDIRSLIRIYSMAALKGKRKQQKTEIAGYSQFVTKIRWVVVVSEMVALPLFLWFPPDFTFYYCSVCRINSSQKMSIVFFFF